MEDLGVVDKVRRALQDSEYDAVIAVGADNVQYLIGATLPFLSSYPDRYVIVLWPRIGYPVCICPLEWESTIRGSSWIRKICPYIERAGDIDASVKALVRAVSQIIKKGSKVGIDISRVSCTFFDRLEKSLCGVEIAGCDDWFRELRMIKTPKEAELLEDVSYRTDHGIVGAAHHVIITTTRTEMSLAEEIRVHCLERELDMVGHHSLSQVASGRHSRKFWPLAPRFGVGWDKVLKERELVRLEMRSSLDGYWSDASRILFMGEPTPEQRKSYKGLVALKRTAVRNLKPRTRCNVVYKAVREEAARRGIELLPKLGIGHGIGVTAYEAPYLIDGDDTELKPGMILVLDPVIYGPDGEIIRSKDTVLIDETGCKILGWYINWMEPYIPAYTL